MDKVKFTDYSVEVKKKLNEKALIFLEESKDILASQSARNSPRKTSALAQSFLNDSVADDKSFTAYIGSTLEYAIWQEFGTGEYALEGNGRKGGWCYKDPSDGKIKFTRGTRPKRMLYNAYQHKKSAVIERAEEFFKDD